MQKLKITLSYILGGMLLLGAVVIAGSLTPPDGSSTSVGTMYTTSDIYNKLITGTDATEGDHQTSTTTNPNSDGTMRTLKEIYNVIPNLLANTIATGTTYMGITGTLYGDTDPSKVLNTATYPGTATAGVSALEWQTPDPDVDLCWGPYDSTWEGGVPDSCLTGGAVDYCDNLVYQGHDDWRLPSVGELFDAFYIGIPDSFGSLYYWSRFEYEDGNQAWVVDIDKNVGQVGKDIEVHVRCVR